MNVYPVGLVIKLERVAKVVILSTKGDGGWGGGKQKSVYEGRKGRARGFIMMAKLSALGGYVLFSIRGKRQTWVMDGVSWEVDQEGPTTWRSKVQPSIHPTGSQEDME